MTCLCDHSCPAEFKEPAILSNWWLRTELIGSATWVWDDECMWFLETLQTPLHRLTWLHQPYSTCGQTRQAPCVSWSSGVTRGRQPFTGVALFHTYQLSAFKEIFKGNSVSIHSLWHLGLITKGPGRNRENLTLLYNQKIPIVHLKPNY